MTHLIPEKRLNKNGVLVTKHVRAASSSAGSKAIPAPVVAPKESPEFEPSLKQSKQLFRSLSLDYRRSNDVLVDALKTKPGEYYGATTNVMFTFRASDVELYDVHSVMSLGNTVVMLRAGITTKEEALETLDRLNLNRLREYNAEVTDAMLRSGVSMMEYYRFAEECPYGIELDPEDYAGAARIFTLKSLEQYKSNADQHLYEGVMNGHYTADDVLTIGGGRFSAQRRDIDVILDALRKVKNGTVEYDAKQLGEYIDQTSNYLGLKPAMAMADNLGMSFLLGIDKIWKAYGLAVKTEERDFEAQREIITYGDQIERLTDNKSPYSLDYDSILKLHGAGVEPQLAVSKTEEGYTAEQIIAIYQEGIAPSVSSGWL